MNAQEDEIARRPFSAAGINNNLTEEEGDGFYYFSINFNNEIRPSGLKILFSSLRNSQSHTARAGSTAAFAGMSLSHLSRRVQSIQRN